MFATDEFSARPPASHSGGQDGWIQKAILALKGGKRTTASEQRKVIETLERLGLRHNVKIMVGGGAITEEFSEDIGADGYDPTAVGAVKLAKRSLEEQ
jgi:methanogenic corrinoid protein MtbC1